MLENENLNEAEKPQLNIGVVISSFLFSESDFILTDEQTDIFIELYKETYRNCNGKEVNEEFRFNLKYYYIRLPEKLQKTIFDTIIKIMENRNEL